MKGLAGGRWRLIALAMVLAASCGSPIVAQRPLQQVLGEPPEDGYLLEVERIIGDYTIRLWGWQERFFGPRGRAVVIITGPSATTVEVDWAFQIGPLSGTDITGEGNPDLIVTGYSGGAHCCFSSTVYDLGPTLTVIPVAGGGNCSGTFEDLDGDGSYEFLTCDDAFAYHYCCYAGSPMVRVILCYERKIGYVPASPRFASLYEPDIVAHTELAQQATDATMCEWDETSKCAVLPLILDYLYSGRMDQAWEVLERYYSFPDADTFRAEIEAVVRSSPRFMLPEGSVAETSNGVGGLTLQ